MLSTGLHFASEFTLPLKKPHAALPLCEVTLADQANRTRLCALCAFYLDETDCPSSDDLRQFGCFRKGGSG